MSQLAKKCDSFLFGADYNPDQWRNTPEVWGEDIRLMKLTQFSRNTKCKR